MSLAICDPRPIECFIFCTKVNELQNSIYIKTVGEERGQAQANAIHTVQSRTDTRARTPTRAHTNRIGNVKPMYTRTAPLTAYTMHKSHTDVTRERCKRPANAESAKIQESCMNVRNTSRRNALHDEREPKTRSRGEKFHSHKDDAKSSRSARPEESSGKRREKTVVLFLARVPRSPRLAARARRRHYFRVVADDRALHFDLHCRCGGRCSDDWHSTEASDSLRSERLPSNALCRRRRRPERTCTAEKNILHMRPPKTIARTLHICFLRSLSTFLLIVQRSSDRPAIHISRALQWRLGESPGTGCISRVTRHDRLRFAGTFSASTFLFHVQRQLRPCADGRNVSKAADCGGVRR